MQSLIHHHDVDYRLIYLLEDAVRERIDNIYMSRSHQRIPPFFEEIILDMCDLAALLYVERVGQTGTLGHLDMEYISIIRQTGDPELAILFLQQHAPSNFLDEFQRDIHLYLLAHNLNFFLRPFNRFEATFRESRLINPTIIQVW